MHSISRFQSPDELLVTLLQFDKRSLGCLHRARVTLSLVLRRAIGGVEFVKRKRIEVGPRFAQVMEHHRDR